MPELPEVETTARGLRELIVGVRISKVGGIDWPPMLPNVTAEELERALLGRSVERVGRRGKYLLLGLDDGAWLVVHRKMTGNLVVAWAGAPLERHTHLVLSFEDGRQLRFVDPRKFGRVYFFPTEAELDLFLAARLGPEPLEGFTSDQLGELLARRRGRLKALLLNQLFLAGIGNLYTDEILWEARLHPLRLASSLSREEVERLHRAIRSVLERAIELRGTSIDDYLDATGQPGRNQDYLQVYGRHGKACSRCGEAIVRTLVGARGTWWCRRCQA